MALETNRMQAADMKGSAMTHDEIARRIEAEKDALAAAVVARDCEEHPEYREGTDDHAREMHLRDTAYHLEFLAQAVGLQSRKLFSEYVVWAHGLLDRIGIPAEALADNLKNLGLVIEEAIGPEAGRAAAPYLGEALSLLRRQAAQPPSFMDPAAPLAEPAADYLSALLRADRGTANRLILDLAESGAALQDIYLHVFERTQREVGRLWQVGEITVAQEHFCTAATQSVMAQLYPRLFAVPKRDLTVVAACAGGELHEIGARLVSDFLEMSGWNATYLGANVPTSALVQELKARRPHLLAVSATMTFHLPRVLDIVEAVRAEGGDLQMPVMVGGYPFNVDDELWRKVGADGYAPDARSAVDVAAGLVSAGRGTDDGLL